MQLLGPADTQEDNGHLTHDELHDVRRRRDYAREDRSGVLQKRLPTTEAVERNRNRDMADAMDTTEDFRVISPRPLLWVSE